MNDKWMKSLSVLGKPIFEAEKSKPLGMGETLIEICKAIKVKLI